MKKWIDVEMYPAFSLGPTIYLACSRPTGRQGACNVSIRVRPCRHFIRSGNLRRPTLTALPSLPKYWGTLSIHISLINWQPLLFSMSLSLSKLLIFLFAWPEHTHTHRVKCNIRHLAAQSHVGTSNWLFWSASTSGSSP